MFQCLMRYGTLRDIDEAGLDVRAWCFRCGRGLLCVTASLVLRFDRHGWSLALPDAAARFRCRRCRSADQVLLLPATPVGGRPKRPTAPRTWAQEVEAFFHAKRSRRDR